MLIRVGGGMAGIKEYLEEGRKEGRELTRDEMDRRIFLEGDLAITDSIIQSIDGERERYLHVTLAFKEDDITPETLREITAEFRQFAMAASRSDEYNFYAEAHYPKTRSYVDAQTGNLIERKPHIHVVIPRLNLLTWKDLNPFDMVEYQTKWLSAFQEHINQKYGLASPKDNPRYRFTGESEMIARYKGDLFEGGNRELRERIMGEVLDRNITRYEDYTALLADYGDVRTRNAGRPGEYLNVKPTGDTKGINLKDQVFSRQFIELPTEEKHRRLLSDVVRKYEVAAQSRPTDAELLATVQDWREIRSKELKYLHSDSKFYKQTYLPADAVTRRRLLGQLEADFYHQHGESHDIPTPKPHAAGIGRNPPPVARGRLRALSELGVVFDKNAEQQAGSGEVLLPGNVPGQLEHHGADVNHSLRRVADRPRGRNDSVIGQLAADLAESKAQRQSGDLAEFADIRRTLDARSLLNHLSKTHGLLPEKYEVTKGKDGGDRIVCGKHKLNVSDFLTREMRLPFGEAAPILRQCYAAQQAHMRSEPSRQTGSDSTRLWQGFQAWKQEVQAPQAKADWQRQQQTERDRKAAIKADWLRDKARIGGDRSLAAAPRRAALSIARMQRIDAETKLRQHIADERAAHREQHPKRHAELYQIYLVGKAELGNEQALAELRRKNVEATPAGDRIQPPVDEQNAMRNKVLRELDYRIHRNGDVTYSMKGKAALADTGHTVKVLQANDRDVIETGLRLAQAKFGDKLSINGSAEFRKQAVELAVEKNLRVSFTDPALEAYKQRLIGERQMALQAKAASKPQPQPARAAKPTPDAPRQASAAPPAAAPAPTMDSQPAKGNGSYQGEIQHEDGHYLYQDVGRKTLVRHDKAALAARNVELPHVGDTVKLQYAEGVLQQMKEIDRGRSGHGR